MIYQTFFFVFSLIATFYLGLVLRVFSHWTAGLNFFLPLLACFVASSAIGYFLRKKLTVKPIAILFTLAAILAFVSFGNTIDLVHTWQLKSLRIGLSYDEWHIFAMGRLAFWAFPLTIALVISWFGTSIERGRLSLIVGASLGVILMRIVCERVSTALLFDYSLLLLFIGSFGLLIVAYKHWWAKVIPGILGLFVLLGWYFTSQKTPYEMLVDINPFASIASRDVYYTGIGTKGYTLKEGRVLSADTIDLASRTAAQLLPLVLRPAVSARIAARTQDKVPLIEGYERGELKGAYDVIYVELPPAWIAEERDYFNAAAIKAVINHLTPSGLMVYTLDVHGLDARALMLRIAILKQSFPYLQLWVQGEAIWQIVASREKITTDFVSVSNLMDRDTVLTPCVRAGLATTVSLFSAYLTDDPDKLFEALVDPIQRAKLRRREASFARKTLFDRNSLKALGLAFEPFRDISMSWITLPTTDTDTYAEILKDLQLSRALAIQGDFLKASQINPFDPYLLGFADREIENAKQFEKLAEHDKAIASFSTAFQIANPPLPAVLMAAEIAQKSAKTEQASKFYKLAESIDPENLAMLLQYAHFLAETKAYQAAEQKATQVLKSTDDRAIQLMAYFFIQRMIASQGHIEAAFAATQAKAASVTTKADKAIAIPAYGDLLIEFNNPVLGVKVKRHFNAYGELLPMEASK